MLTTHFGVLVLNPAPGVSPARYAARFGDFAAPGVFMYEGHMLASVPMSVEPWTLASPRSALMPPPATPMLPRSIWTRAMARTFCEPYVCCVCPIAYRLSLIHIS